MKGNFHVRCGAGEKAEITSKPYLSLLKAGFFKTPIKQGDYLLSLLDIQGSGTWFDPTCGEGEILHHIAQSSKTDTINIKTYGVELDKTRANKASEVLDYCINAPIESMVISNDSVSLLFLNPPYDHTIKGMEDDSADRKEWTELFRNTRYLKDNGLMIYIIPSYRFADTKIARFLSTNFKNIGILKFSDEDYPDFRQCIFIGNKKESKHKEVNNKLYQFLLQMDSEDFIEKKVTPIDKLAGHHKWKVPAGGTELKTFYTKLANKSDFVEGIRQSKGFTAFMNRSKPKQLEIGGDPILPLNQGLMALLLATGAVNGEIGEGDNYHIVQGLELVSKIVEEEKKHHDNGSTTTKSTTRTVRSVSVKTISPSGVVRKLV